MRSDPSRAFLRPAILGALLASVAAALALHVPHLPPWLPAVLALVAAWRLRLEVGHQPLPGRWVVASLTLAALLAVLASYRFIPGFEGGLAVVALLTGLKLLEMASQRDRAQVVFLGYFLVFGAFLRSQSIPVAGYGAGVVLLLTATLAVLEDPSGGRPARAHLRLAGVLLTQAAPLAVALFLLFPRVATPLWRLGGPDRDTALSGLPDSLEPGSVSRLLLSGAVAFRAAFRGPEPAPELLYWRGPVFGVTDGGRWTARHLRGAEEPHPFPLGASPPEAFYTVTAEPNSGPWLLTLDRPLAAPEGGVLTPERSVRSRRPVDRRVRYQARSRLASASGAPDPEGGARSLQLPARVSPRVRALALQWRRQARADRDVVSAALDYFRREPFVYTLRPPRGVRDPVDEFLFETRRGFCEHFAGSFALLMRLAGVPARVVAGYQGGERNPLGGYWVVRQADAHAWAEVYLEGRGWVRVDPTAAVAPERIELGIDAAAAAGGAVRYRAPDTGRLARAIGQLWDSVDHGWNQWVLGYDLERQLALLARLGLPDASWADLALWIAASCAFLISLLWLQAARPRHPRADPVQRLYLDYCRRLGRAGLVRRPWEGPVAFRDRVAEARPDLARSAEAVTRLYARLRYGEEPSAAARREGLHELRGQVRALRPGRRPGVRGSWSRDTL